jgi:hypothetical protein
MTDAISRILLLLVIMAALEVYRRYQHHRISLLKAPWSKWQIFTSFLLLVAGITCIFLII